jgi:hypothetical protein
VGRVGAAGTAPTSGFPRRPGRADNDGVATSVLSLRVVVPPLGGDGVVELRPHADGDDLVGRAFHTGPAEDPAVLLGGPLEAAAQPHEVRLAEAECTEGCCGALYVTIRRDGDQVVWDGWHNPDTDEVDLPPLRFDAGQYAAELARADADRSWEWPARTVARLLEAELRAAPDRLARWGCELGGVAARPGRPDRLYLYLFSPGRDAMARGEPWQQLELVVPVTADDPPAQARAAAALLTAADPRATARICGGSPTP